MLKIGKAFTISLVALSLSTMLETQAQAALTIKTIGTAAAVCAVTTGVSPNQCVAYYDSTTCHRSGATPSPPGCLGGNFGGGASTCDDLVNGAFRCRQASLDLEKDEFYAAAPETSETDMLTMDPTVTFAATPGPEQVATFVSMAASDPMILAAKSTGPPLLFVAYLVDSGGAGAGNLDLNPAVAIATFRPTTVGIHCLTNGLQDGGVGKPFFPSVLFTGTDPFDDSNLTGRGQWKSIIAFTIEQLQAAITVPDDACKQNWQFIPDSLTVLTAIIDLVTYACSESTCTAGFLTPTDRWAQNCTYNISDGTDSCTTIFHCHDLDTAEERAACLGQNL